MQSLHLQSFPAFAALPDHIATLQAMEAVRDICSAALSIRKIQGIRVRMPLSSISIYTPDCSVEDKSYALYQSIMQASYADIIKDELNVRDIVFQSNFEKITTTVIVLNFKVCGHIFGSHLKAISNIIKHGKDGDEYKISPEDQHGHREIVIPDICTLKSSEDHFSITYHLKPQAMEQQFKMCRRHCIVIQLDTVIDESLVAECIARDAVSLVQQIRKQLQLELDKIIKIKFTHDDEVVVKALNNPQWKNYIAEQVLADIAYMHTETTAQHLAQNIVAQHEFSQDLDTYGPLGIMFLF